MPACPYCGDLLRWGLIREEPELNEHRFGCLVPDVGGSKKVVVYGRAAADTESLEKAEQPKWWQFWWWF
jgi:hypothetical protein